MSAEGEHRPDGGGRLVITAFNQKGGIGKTTTSVNLAVCLAAFGKRVVLVDLDSQGNATTSVGVTQTVRKGAYELITGKASLTEASQPTRFPGLSLCGASDELAGVDIELAHLAQSQHLLRAAVHAEQEEFDVIVIDCPPALGMLPVNALVAADVALMPVAPQPLAHDGLHKAWRHIHRIRDNLNPDLVIDGILLTFASDDPMAAEQAQLIRGEFGRSCLPMEVPVDSRVIAASKADLPVVVFDPACPAAQAYLKLTQHFLAVTESRRRRVPIIARKDGEGPVPRAAVVPPDTAAALAVLEAWRAGQMPRPSPVQQQASQQQQQQHFSTPDAAGAEGWVAVTRSEAPLEIDWVKVWLVLGTLAVCLGLLVWLVAW